MKSGESLVIKAGIADYEMTSPAL